MQKFIKHKGIVCPLDYANIDTDQIIPKQFLLSVSKQGFGKHLFHDLRYLDEKESVLNPDFKLNQEPYKNASILLTRANFGSGSSREHAPWALMDFGIRAVLAPSFADIFKNNALGNGLLTVVLKEEEIDYLFIELEKQEDKHIEICLENKKVFAFGKEFSFDLDEFHRTCLLNGLDRIDLTLMHQKEIKDYENKARVYLV